MTGKSTRHEDWKKDESFEDEKKPMLMSDFVPLPSWRNLLFLPGGYRFIADNYLPGDKICLFGFSRGAYTARALAGMIEKVGLIPANNHEQLQFAWVSDRFLVLTLSRNCDLLGYILDSLSSLPFSLLSPTTHFFFAYSSSINQRNLYCRTSLMLVPST